MIKWTLSENESESSQAPNGLLWVFLISLATNKVVEPPKFKTKKTLIKNEKISSIFPIFVLGGEKHEGHQQKICVHRNPPRSFQWIHASFFKPPPSSARVTSLGSQAAVCFNSWSTATGWLKSKCLGSCFAFGSIKWWISWQYEASSRCGGSYETKIKTTTKIWSWRAALDFARAISVNPFFKKGYTCIGPPKTHDAHSNENSGSPTANAQCQRPAATWSAVSPEWLLPWEQFLPADVFTIKLFGESFAQIKYRFDRLPFHAVTKRKCCKTTWACFQDWKPAWCSKSDPWKIMLYKGILGSKVNLLPTLSIEALL